METETLQQRMAMQAAQFAQGNGKTPSPIPKVNIIYADQSHPRMPVMYEPSIVIIFQGHKMGYTGRKSFCYSPSEYLLMTVPLPFECAPQRAVVLLVRRSVACRQCFYGK